MSDKPSEEEKLEQALRCSDGVCGHDPKLYWNKHYPNEVLAAAFRAAQSELSQAIEKAANYEKELSKANKRAEDAEAELLAARCQACGTPKLGEHHPDCEFHKLKRIMLTITEKVQHLLGRCQKAEAERDSLLAAMGEKDKAIRDCLNSYVSGNEAHLRLEKALSTTPQDALDRLKENLCDCGRKLSPGTCSICDNDE